MILDLLEKPMARLLAASLTASLALFAFGCSGDEKEGDDGVKASGGGGGGGDAKDSGGGGGGEASANRVTLAQSLSNNSLTSLSINGDKASNFGGGKDKKNLEGKISADRISKKGVSAVMGSARKLADLEMQKQPGKAVDDVVKLDIALAAIQAKNFYLAEFYLQALTESKNAKVKAGALNALGVVALNDGRVPEAVTFFREALKAVGNYKPAKYNLGFTALKGGDLGTAKSALGDYQNDWFVKYAMISIARMEGDANRANSLCDAVLGKEKGHKAALFNCGLVEAQNKKNYSKAKEYMKRAQGAKGGESSWDERIVNQLTEIELDQAKAKQEQQEKGGGKKGNGGGSGSGSGGGSA